MTSRILIVTTTLPEGDLAQAIADRLVQARLAACVQIGPAVDSTYRWHDGVEHARETVVTIKTTPACYRALEEALRSMHPYEVPEILAVAANGSEMYARWVEEATMPQEARLA